MFIMVVPLIVVVPVFVYVLGPLTSNWIVLSKYPWLWVSPLSSTTPPVSPEKESKKRLDFPSQVVVEVQSMEEAISDDFMLNWSSTPPQAIESIHVQPVRTLALLPVACLFAINSGFHSYMQFFSF